MTCVRRRRARNFGGRKITCASTVLRRTILFHHIALNAELSAVMSNRVPLGLGKLQALRERIPRAGPARWQDISIKAARKFVPQQQYPI